MIWTEPTQNHIQFWSYGFNGVKTLLVAVLSMEQEKCKWQNNCLRRKTINKKGHVGRTQKAYLPLTQISNPTNLGCS
jgi:hypothetical protein